MEIFANASDLVKKAKSRSVLISWIFGVSRFIALSVFFSQPALLFEKKRSRARACRLAANAALLRSCRAGKSFRLTFKCNLVLKLSWLSHGDDPFEVF